jgi:hypothetical protein
MDDADVVLVVDTIELKLIDCSIRVHMPYLAWTRATQNESCVCTPLLWILFTSTREIVFLFTKVCIAYPGTMCSAS